MGGFFGIEERSGDGDEEDHEDEAERDGDREMPVPHLVEDGHLETDEHQDDAEPVLEQVEQVHRLGEEEVEVSQAEDREHVGGEHDQRFVGDGEDRGDRVEGEHHVGHLQEGEGDEQGRRLQDAVLANEEVLAVDARGHRHGAPEPLDQDVLVRIHPAFVVRGHHPVAGEDQEERRG